MERKLAHAREFQRIFNLRRPILVDDLEGTGHQSFGTLPNMTYIIDQRHRVAFRADWTDVSVVQMALEYLLGARARRGQGSRSATYFAELLGTREVDQPTFDAGLRRNGPKAYTEFYEAMEQRQRQTASQAQ